MWLTSFLVHEFMHIKSQGILMGGTIYVNEFGMTVDADEIYNLDLFYLSGGLYSGIIFMLLGIILFYYNAVALYIPSFTFGFINLTYGFWEFIHGAEGRWKIYLTSTIISIIFWLVCIFLGYI